MTFHPMRARTGSGTRWRTASMRMTEAMNGYLDEKSAEFVVTRNLEISPEGYQLIQDQTFWSEGQDDTFRLYQRVN